MTRHTNKTIEIYENVRDWEGNLSSSLVGTYDVYLEETATKEVFSNPYDEGSHSDAVQNSSRGFFMLFVNLNLDGKTISYDGTTYTIKGWDRFVDRKGNFHHIEATYK
jgi:hypothetical protein